MITRELPQYAEIVRHLTPVLAGLPPKLIAIDGPMGSGKCRKNGFSANELSVAGFGRLCGGAVERNWSPSAPEGVRVRPEEGRTDEASKVHGRADYRGIEGA
jgi:hypothetical protein